MTRRPDPTVRIGISGWNYPPWRSVFYPHGLRQADELAYASREFPSIEINGSFYSLQRPTTYRKWYDTVPADFVFGVKGGRYVTHMKRLRDAERGLANFFASGLLCLEEKLGPILWQLPPALRFDAGVLEEFFRLLPRNFDDAAKLARGHDPRFADRVSFGPGGRAKLRYALEVRHPSFLQPEFIQLLRRHDVAPCVADSAGLYPQISDLTADFVYLRLHGAEQLYTSSYTARELSQWARRIRAWNAGNDANDAPPLQPARADGKPRPVFVYFDNDVKAHAPFDAKNLARAVSGKRPLATPSPSVVAQVSEEPRETWAAWRAPRAVRERRAEAGDVRRR
jgi:uncharacterized protein YecE (DUF72 family)